MSNLVVFNPPVRTSSKRKRMPGTNKYAKEEVKKAAMFTSTGSLADIYNLFEFSNILGIYGSDTNNAVTINFRGSWYPIPIVHPTVGSSGYERIGQQYFLKYLRMKGYCLVKANCIRPVHWRLRLIRVEDEGVFVTPSSDMSQTSAVNTYLSIMFRNPLLLATNDAATTKAIKLATNYYCALKTELETQTIRSKIIASGTINSVNVPNVVGEVAPGANSAWAGLVSNALGIDNENWGYSKFDCRVLVNDNISFDLFTSSSGTNNKFQASDVDYYVCLETDLPLGYDITPPNAGNDLPHAGTILNSTSRLDEVFALRFTQIQYFTDP